MAPSQRLSPNKPETNKTLLSHGLAIVLKKSPTPETKTAGKKKNRRQPPKEDQRCKDCEEIADYEFGPEVFADWVRQNGDCFWNPCLVQSVKSLEYKGFVRPTTLLVGGTDYSSEVVRTAWGRRMLRPPIGYDIVMLGDLDPVTMSLVAQTQFAPLPEALCKVVYDLTSEGSVASLQIISKKLKTAFPEIMVPSEDILYKTLGTLIKERKLYHTGSGYSVVTPDTFRLLAMSPPFERQMLLTNEEAIVRLHGAAYAMDDGRTACTQTKQQETLTAWSSAERIVEPRKQGVSIGKLKRCHSLKLLRSRDKEKLSRSNSFKSNGTTAIHDSRSDNDNSDTIKKEKFPSMFSKWFRRGRSDKNRGKSKGTSSATQFPPRDWTDPDYVIFNSRSTQTLERNEGEHKSKGRSSSLNRTSGKDRNSHHVYSNPATPRVGTRNSNRHSSDRNRSSSLSRKFSPSPKRDAPQQTSTPKPTKTPNTQEPVKIRPRYESPFSPFKSNQKTQPLLMANEKYNEIQTRSPSLLTGKATPYQSTDIIKSFTNANPPSSSFNGLLRNKVDTSAGWRRPTSLVSNFYTPTVGMGDAIKPPPVRVIPRISLTPREVPQQPIQTPNTKTIVSTIKSSETLTKTFPNDGKELKLGTIVDVEISVGNNSAPQGKKTLLTTDLDNTVQNDLLKIATSWNQSIKSNNSKPTDMNAKLGIPKLTTTTNITTSFSRGPANLNKSALSKTLNPRENGKDGPLIDCSLGRDSPSKDTICSGSPRSTMTSDTKSEFFSDSPNTTTEVHVSKDDSGFSSSASTSRPMSVSPC